MSFFKFGVKRMEYKNKIYILIFFIFIIAQFCVC